MRTGIGRISESEQKPRIDVKDKKLLALLSQNGRMPASDIAHILKLSRDAIAYRIAKLQERGVILRFCPIVNLGIFGHSTFHVFMLLDEKRSKEHAKLLEHLTTHNHTKALMTYTDTWDVEWTLIAKDLKEFDTLLTQVLTKFPSVILEKETLAVVNAYTDKTLPGVYSIDVGTDLVSSHKSINSPKLRSKRVDDKDLDGKDLLLLRELDLNCRQSTYELGSSIKLSADAVSYRLRKLNSSGIILQYSTINNLSILGHSWYTYVINFTKFDTKDEAKFRQFVATHPYIIRAVKLFGPWDVMLYIVADSPKNYHETVKEIKAAFSEILHHYQTWLSHKELYFTMLPRVVIEVEHSRKQVSLFHNI